MQCWISCRKQTNAGFPAMMKRGTFAVANIYVPVKRRAVLDPKKAQEIAESILQIGLQSPTWCGRTANVSSWWKGCIVSRRASNSARKPSSDTSCRPAGINGLRRGARWRRAMLTANMLDYNEGTALIVPP